MQCFCKAGTILVALSAMASVVAASADGSELDVKEHLQGSAKLETDGAFSALVMLKPEIGLPHAGLEQRLPL